MEKWTMVQTSEKLSTLSLEELKKCPISLETMKEPTFLMMCGVIFERQSLIEALRKQPGIDPFTKFAAFCRRASHCNH
jgi:hypothetical protein